MKVQGWWSARTDEVVLTLDIASARVLLVDVDALVEKDPTATPVMRQTRDQLRCAVNECPVAGA